MNTFATMSDLKASLADIERAPSQQGRVDLIVCRPAVNQRRELELGQLNLEQGLVGDNWRARVAGAANQPICTETQLNLINSRVMTALERDRDRWKFAGDQFYVDLDLSKQNAPAGTRFKIGTAVIEVTEEPHLACKKFADRFGADAARFVNSESGRQLNLRGINAKVILPGEVSVGACIVKLKA